MMTGPAIPIQPIRIVSHVRHVEWDKRTLKTTSMKLSPALIQAITLGVAVAALSSSCHQNEVNSGRTKEIKAKKEKPVRDNCPACGMG